MNAEHAGELHEVIPAALGGERLDRIVALLADVSRSIAAGVIRDGGVRVDGMPATSGKLRVAAGATVAVDPARLPVDELPAADPDVEFVVVHEDTAVIVVDKPAGLVVHPGAGNHSGTLVNGLLARYPELADVGDPHRPGIVHRLDAGSSGLLVVARTAPALGALQQQFGDRAAHREYRALVWGHPDAAHGVIDAPIGRDPSDPLRMALVADGRMARTEYQVAARLAAPAPVALLDCRLETGRTHQIRVHLAGIGHPLVGDVTYGGRRPTLGLDRPFLHAVALSFVHPATGDTVRFTSELAPDLAALLTTLTS